MEQKISYEVLLYLDGRLIGNIRRIAEGLKWVRKRTRMGVDSISFTVNDYLLATWCNERATSVDELLRPLALECRIVRNGVEVVGGFLATMPAYSAQGQSANLTLNFDGFLNLLAGVYLHPQATQHGKMGALIQNWITEANQRSSVAGKALGAYLGARNDDNPALFISNQNGRRITAGNVRRVFQNTCARSEFEGVHPHTIRHSFATYLLERHVDLRYIADLMGHQSLDTTKMYTHYSNPRLKQIYDLAMNS